MPSRKTHPIVFAMRRPITVLVAVLALVLTCAVAVRPKGFDAALQKLGIELPLKRMPVDIFPALNLPVIYVSQPYGGMDPAQMEGLLTNYYEYHFLYISGRLSAIGRIAAQRPDNRLPPPGTGGGSAAFAPA